MTVTLEQASNTYLDDIADSAGYEYIKAQGVDLLVTNIGVVVEQAQDIVDAWLKRNRKAQA